MHGLDEYDSEARWYYPAIMRTTTMDPLCEKYYSTSPYAWCGNNPVNLVDPDGRDWYFNNDSNRYCYNEEILSQKDIDDRKINGTYKAQTFEDEAYYYGLFGYKYNQKSVQNTSVAKYIDAVLIGHAMKIAEEQADKTSESFGFYKKSLNVPDMEYGWDNRKMIKYAGMDVLYIQQIKNKMYTHCFNPNWEKITDATGTYSISGYLLKFQNESSQTNYPLVVYTKDKAHYEKIMNIYFTYIYWKIVNK